VLVLKGLSNYLGILGVSTDKGSGAAEEAQHKGHGAAARRGEMQRCARCSALPASSPFALARIACEAPAAPQALRDPGLWDQPSRLRRPQRITRN